MKEGMLFVFADNIIIYLKIAKEWTQTMNWFNKVQNIKLTYKNQYPLRTHIVSS